MRDRASFEKSTSSRRCLPKANGNSLRKYKIDYPEDGKIYLESLAPEKFLKKLDIISITYSSSQLVLSVLDGSTLTIDLPPIARMQSDLNNILEDISGVWNEYFPSYNFCEAIFVEGDDTPQLLALEDTSVPPDISSAVERSSFYLRKFFQINFNASEILEYFACKEHKYLRFPDDVSNFSDDETNSAICCLLAPSFFTVLDLGCVKMDEDFIHFCSIGLRTDKALRSLVFRESQLDSDELGSLLRCIPSSSKLRKLNIASPEIEFSKVFGDLKPKIYQQLIDLRIGSHKIDNGTYMKIIAHIKPTSEKLPLRQIVLSNTCIRPVALQELTSLMPQLRVLFLNRCDLEISEVCSALSSSNCIRLEFLSLAENKFTKSDAVIENYFASLRFLRRLSLKGTSGEAAADVLKMIFKGLQSIANPVYNCLSLDLGDCNLDAKAAEVIAKWLPKVNIKKILLDENAFGDKVIDIIKRLPKCPRLTHIALGHKGRPATVGVLKKLAGTLVLPECKVDKLVLGPLGSIKELCEFLKFLANVDTRLTYLDVADYALKDDDAKYILGLIQWSDRRIPFNLIFDSSNFSDSTWTALKRLAKQKGFLISQRDKSTALLQQLTVDVKALMEVDIFNNAIITPSPELCDADLELTRLEIRLQRKVSTINVKKSDSHYPKIHQARKALQECSTLPSMHVELLDAALDPEECNRVVNQAMGEIRAVLQRTLEAFQRQSCQRLKDVVNNKSLRSFASVANFSPQITSRSLESVSQLLNQQVERSIRSMLLDANAKVAEEMLCRVTTGLKDDLVTCLNGFSDCINSKPSKSVTAVDEEYAAGPRRSYTVPAIGEEAYSVGNALYASDAVFADKVPEPAPPQNRGEHASVAWTPKKDQASSGIQLPTIRARPIRQKAHTVATIIHTSDSEVVHGPIDTTDLFPASDPPPEVDRNKSSDSNPPSISRPPRPFPAKPVIPGPPNADLLSAIKNRNFSLQNSPQPSPPVSAPNDPDPSEDDTIGNFAKLRQRFENCTQASRTSKSMYQLRPEGQDE